MGDAATVDFIPFDQLLRYSGEMVRQKYLYTVLNVLRLLLCCACAASTRLDAVLALGFHAPMCCPGPIGFIYEPPWSTNLFFGAGILWLAFPAVLTSLLTRPYSLVPGIRHSCRRLTYLLSMPKLRGAWHTNHILRHTVYELYIPTNWHTNFGLGWRWSFGLGGFGVWFCFFVFLS